MNLLFLASGPMAIPTLIQCAQLRMVRCLVLPSHTFDGKNDLLEISQAFQIPVLEVNKKNVGPQLKKAVATYAIEGVLTLSFSFMIPADVLKTAKGQWFNIHFGALPKYAGAQPVFWQIRHGEPTGQITIHHMTTKADAGDVAFTQTISIDAHDTHASLTRKYTEATPLVVMQFIQQWVQGLALTPQIPTSISFNAIPQLSDVCIAWDRMSAMEIIQLIRACNDWNKGAIAFIGQQQLKIADAALAPTTLPPEPAGTLVPSSSQILVHTHDQRLIALGVVCTDHGILSAKSWWESLQEIPTKFSVYP